MWHISSRGIPTYILQLKPRTATLSYGHPSLWRDHIAECHGWDPGADGWGLPVGSVPFYVGDCLKKNIYLSGCTRNWFQHVGSAIFTVPCGIFSCGMATISCSMWDLVHWPGIEPGPSALAAWSLPATGPPGKPPGDFALSLISSICKKGMFRQPCRVPGDNSMTWFSPVVSSEGRHSRWVKWGQTAACYRPSPAPSQLLLAQVASFLKWPGSTERYGGQIQTKIRIWDPGGSSWVQLRQGCPLPSRCQDLRGPQRHWGWGKASQRLCPFRAGWGGTGTQVREKTPRPVWAAEETQGGAEGLSFLLEVSGNHWGFFTWRRTWLKQRFRTSRAWVVDPSC